MLMPYLIHYQKNFALSFQHAVSRTIQTRSSSSSSSISPVAVVVLGVRSRPTPYRTFSTRCGRSVLLQRPYNTPKLCVTSQTLSFSSSSAAAATVEDESDDNNNMAPSYPKFDDVSQLHPVLKRNLKELKLETMTEIQSKTWEAASAGQDVLGRARTGTGKTVAFLLPAIQQLLLRNETKSVQDQTKVQMLILSPTRELAAQIHDQALKLTKSANHIISHQCMFGGSSKTNDVAMLEKKVPMILVATPGRIKDHLENTLINGGKRSFKSLLTKVQILVLDETDR
jgi:superfamily II DNA/RNA helicase